MVLVAAAAVVFVPWLANVGGDRRRNERESKKTGSVMFKEGL